VEKAQQAAKAVGAKVIIPQFTEESKKLGYTDFNDLAKCKMGKSRVQKSVEIPDPISFQKQRHRA
jgi:hypothetical protein